MGGLLLAGAESVPGGSLTQGLGLSRLSSEESRTPTYSLNTHAPDQTYGLDISTARTISPLPAAASLAQHDFHELSRAGGPRTTDLADVSRQPRGDARRGGLLHLPTVLFKVLFVFVVLTHDRRRVLHIDVTHAPTAQWTAQQLVEAFPGDTAPQ